MEKTSSPVSSPTSGAKLSLMRVLVGAVLGILTGLFLGDYAHFFRPIGQAYLMLLEVAVYPYLITSLLHGLGSMNSATAWRLFKTGWPFYLFLWGVTFGLLWLFTLAVPRPLPTHLEQTKDAIPALADQLLNLLIPSDFFAVLSQNYVPAVVVFCVFFGVAFQRVKEKKELLSILDAIRQASFIFWSYIVSLTPLAVFALLADSAGTINLQGIGSIGLFVFLFMLGIFILSFWIIPGCIRALTPFRFSEVLSNLKSALLISIITTLPSAAIPFVIEATKELAERCGIDDPERDDVIRTHITVAYPLAQLGNMFVYFFVVFAAFETGKSLSPTDSAILPVITLLSCFGTPASAVNAVSFISTTFHLPASVGDLYLELMAVLRYGQVIASAMGIAFLSYIVTLAYFGKVKIRWGQLLGVLGSAAMLVLVTALVSKHLYTGYLNNAPDPYLSFTLDPTLTKNISVSFAPEGERDPLGPSESVIERIQRTGVLRVGYNNGVIPFCYRNAKGELVGYDVSYAYWLAQQIKVKVRFVPFKWEELDQRLNEGDFDIVMSGIYLTQQRLVKGGVSNPYYQSPLAFFTPSDRGRDFLTRDQVLARPGLRIGIFDDSILVPILKDTFPRVTVVTGRGYEVLPDFTKIDAAFWSFIQAEALAAAHPGIVAVATEDIGSPLLFVFLTPPKSEEFLKLVNYWVMLNKDSSFGRQQEGYWIHRLPRPDTSPRWSILRELEGK